MPYMNISDLLRLGEKPPLYEKGTAVMWTDPHISGQLLDIHLNPDIDLASRKKRTVEKTIEWILAQLPDRELHILDLGCGPGLYTERLAALGHRVTGVDFSSTAIDHANNQAAASRYGIRYTHGNYLEIDFGAGQYDLVLMVYTDFGVLLPVEREKLLRKVHHSLKKDGQFLFDVLNDHNMEEKTGPQTWEILEKGFWRPHPHMVLFECFDYPEEQVILYQHLILEDDHHEIYRFWTHFFSRPQLNRLLIDHGFHRIRCFEDVLPAEDTWSGENVTFCLAGKRILDT